MNGQIKKYHPKRMYPLYIFLSQLEWVSYKLFIYTNVTT